MLTSRYIFDASGYGPLWLWAPLVMGVSLTTSELSLTSISIWVYLMLPYTSPHAGARHSAPAPAAPLRIRDGQR